MQHFVNDNFKIDIFLDTNILVDYVLGINRTLTHSIDYLNSKRSVRLHSSHYVEFELAEVLKICFFGYSVLGHFPNREEKAVIKSNNWKLNGIDYIQKQVEISKRVTDSLSMLNSTFDRLFDDHVLHEDLISPTCQLLLQSNVSREDSLVTVSSVYPQRYEMLNFVALLSNDNQFCSEVCKNNATINTIMASKGLKEPVIMNAKKLDCSLMGSQFNIAKHDYDDATIEKFWNKKILELVKKKNENAYVGTTYKFGKSGTISGDCIYFRLQNVSLLKNANSFLFFTNDAEETISIRLKTRYGNIELWNDNHPISLPNDNPHNMKYSFRPLEGMLEEDELMKLRESDNLVFYLNE